MTLDQGLVECGQSLARLGIRASLCRMYLADLDAFKEGDHGRFTRMVDGRGKQHGDEPTWIGYVKGFLEDPEAPSAGDLYEEAYRMAVRLGIDVVRPDSVGVAVN